MAFLKILVTVTGPGWQLGDYVSQFLALGMHALCRI